VEYDLEVSKPDEIHLAGSTRIEQSAVPLSMAWYPPITKESFILTVNNQVHYLSKTAFQFLRFTFLYSFNSSLQFLW